MQIASGTSHLIFHRPTGEPVKVNVSDVAYIDTALGSSGEPVGTRVILSSVDETGNAREHLVRESTEIVAQQLSSAVGPGYGFGD